MCTELILAFLYFIAIVLVNYFLFQLLKTNLQNIFYLLKVEKLFTNSFTDEQKKLFYYLIQFKKNIKTIKMFSYLNQLFNSEDLLIIGNTYKFLLKNTKRETGTNTFLEKNENKSFFTNKLYFGLLEKQYLFQK